MLSSEKKGSSDGMKSLLKANLPELQGDAYFFSYLRSCFVIMMLTIFAEVSFKQAPCQLFEP